MQLTALDDQALILRARQLDGPARAEVLQVLFGRYYRKVGAWSLRVCSDPQEAAELAQEVFLRVHTRLDAFRLDSSFSTWIYRITRNLAIDRGMYRQRRATSALEDAPEPRDPAPQALEMLQRQEVVERFKGSFAKDLDPLEARVLYLHYVDGVPLAQLTDTLGLDNKSGAKAYIVSGRRKLDRHFGRWLAGYRGESLGSAT